MATGMSRKEKEGGKTCGSMGDVRHLKTKKAGLSDHIVSRSKTTHAPSEAKAVGKNQGGKLIRRKAEGKGWGTDLGTD